MGKPVRGMLVFLSMIAVASEASALAWKSVAISEDGAKWFVDTDSIKAVDDGPAGAATKAWVKIDYSKVKSEAAREARILFYFRCDPELVKVISWIRYRPNKSVLSTEGRPEGKYDPVLPESVMSAAMREVCKA
jgi:hypothetical protein